jgi:hypothetical protein
MCEHMCDTCVIQVCYRCDTGVSLKQVLNRCTLEHSSMQNRSISSDPHAALLLMARAKCSGRTFGRCKQGSQRGKCSFCSRVSTAACNAGALLAQRLLLACCCAAVHSVLALLLQTALQK